VAVRPKGYGVRSVTSARPSNPRDAFGRSKNATHLAMLWRIRNAPVICTITPLSRAKLSTRLDVLAGRGLIEREVDGRGSYRLANYDPGGGWAQLPVKGLYRHDAIEAGLVRIGLRRAAQVYGLPSLWTLPARVARRSMSGYSALPVVLISLIALA